jgi:hypothetical protein
MKFARNLVVRIKKATRSCLRYMSIIIKKILKLAVPVWGTNLPASFDNRLVRFLSLYRAIFIGLPLVLGLTSRWFGILKSPFAHIDGFAEAIITCSSILAAVAGVLLSMGIRSNLKDNLSRLFVTSVKNTLFFSFLAGFASMLSILCWYSKDEFGTLRWGAVFFLTQLCYLCAVLILFLLRPTK